MLVFYYQWPETGRTYCVCVEGAFPTRLSPIWEGCNTSVMIVPGTHDEERVVGTCGNCGGQVTLPDAWMGKYPPIPTCQSCGALAKTRYPMMEMEGPVEWPKKRTGLS